MIQSLGPVGRRWRTRVSRVQHRLRGPALRTSAFPFVSGDTFRAVADVIVESGEAEITESKLPMTGTNLVFCDVNSIESVIRAIERRPESPKIVVVHNGDVLDTDSVTHLASLVKHVYCVNWMGRAGNISPIPIGLENSWHRRNGQLELFDGCLPSDRPTVLSRPREVYLLAGFDVSTNPDLREPAAAFAQNIPLSTLLTSVVSPKKYQQLLARSFFTLSPPGNGVDCHRTWEAIYQGSVPVVLRSAWPFTDLPLPVLIVDDWTDTQELFSDASAIKETWRRIVDGGSRHAFIPYWLDEMSSMLHADAAQG
jgi:hypothetical protein